MTELFEPTDAADRRLALGATGVLRDFNEAGVLTAADVHVAPRVGRLAGEADEPVLLAAALATRAVRHGSVCVDLAHRRGRRPRPGLAPDRGVGRRGRRPARCVASGCCGGSTACSTSTATGSRRASSAPTSRSGSPGRRRRSTTPRWRPAWRGCSPVTTYDEQRTASRRAATQWTTVLTGGPGTGKTTTVAGLLALLAEQAEVAGGPAAADRADRADGQGVRRGSRRRSRTAAQRLPVDGPGAARTLAGGHPAPAARHPPRQRHPLPAPPRQPAAARRRRGRRVLDGLADDDDPAGRGGPPGRPAGARRRPRPARLRRGRAPCSRTWSPVSPGAPTSPVARLATTHRFGAEIGRLAAALRGGSADDVLEVLRSGAAEVEFVESEDPAALLRPALVEAALAIRTHAEAGRAPRGGGRARPAPAAVRAPRRAVRRAALEPAGRALAVGGDRRPALRADVRRAAAAGDRERLRARGLQRRRRRGRADRRTARGRSSPGGARVWPTSRPAG